MKFSIIIAAYNAEPFIGHCLDTLIGQQYPSDEFEILVVDDASPDNQDAVIERYAAQHPNIRLIRHPRNLCLGGARNTGLRSAQGDWILFVDADDCWVYNDVLSQLDRLQRQYPDTDIIQSTRYTSLPNNQLASLPPSDIPSARMVPREALLTQSLNTFCVWQHCVRRSLLTDNGILFREGHVFEDIDWCLKLHASTQNLLLVDYDFYGYAENPSSITRTPRLQSFLDNIDALVLGERLVNATDAFLPSEREALNRLLIAKSVKGYLRQARLYPTSQSAQALQHLAKQTHLMHAAHAAASPAYKFLFSLIRLFPHTMACCVRCLYQIKSSFRKS